MVSKIIDGHSHMINLNIIRSRGKEIPESVKKRLGHEFTEKNVQEHKEEWLNAMDKLNIEKTVFMATAHMLSLLIRVIDFLVLLL